MASHFPQPDALSDPEALQLVIDGLESQGRFAEARPYKSRLLSLARVNASPDGERRRSERVRQLNAEIADAEDKGAWARAAAAKAELLRLERR